MAPELGDWKVPTSCVSVLSTLCASNIFPFIATNTPLPLESGDAATTTALYRFNGPSALKAVDARIEPTSTTGLSL